MLQGDPHSHILDVSVSEDVSVRLCVMRGINLSYLISICL